MLGRKTSFITTSFKNRGIVCLHDQDLINCEHLTAVDNLDESHRAFAMANAPKKVDL